jgi:thiol-disulfide isomerase/thioredoxin
VKSRKTPLFLLALAFAIAGVVAQRFAGSPEPLMGAPGEVRLAEVWDGRLVDLAGKAQALRQWQGKVLVLNFWAPWCPPCREEIPDFIRLQQRHGEAGLQFVGVALDDPDKVAAFVDETGINYPILLGGDAGAALSMAAGNRLGGLPFTVVFDRRGDAVATLTGGVTEARLEAIVRPLLR